MLTNSDKIVIVGGGSSGWIVASTLIKAYPNRDITLVESNTVPTIGVGEGTVPEIHSWLKYLDIDFNEFLAYSEGSFKITTKFNDWFEKGHSMIIPAWYGDEDMYYNKDSILGYRDWLIKRSLYPETPISDFSEYYFPQHQLIKNNGFTLENIPQLYPFKPMRHSALHVNAIKFAEYLKDKYAKPRGVKHVLGDVATVKGDEYGVKSILLKDCSEIFGDLFVDCTGFKSLLLGDFLGEEWVSVSDRHPNNKAFFAPVAYTDKNIEMEPQTTATAMSAGWAWNTPIYTRIGTGYIYSDRFIDEDSALAEFKAYLDSDKMTINDPHRSEKTDIKKLSMKNGYYKRTFVKNVVAIGLSAGFIDALEATGLYFAFNNAISLVKTIKNGSINEMDRGRYNLTVGYPYSSFSDFIALHYNLSHRNDTEYWNWQTQQTLSENLMEIIRATDFTDGWSHRGNSWLTLFVNMNSIDFNDFNVEKLKLNTFPENTDIKGTFDVVFNRRKENTALWEGISKDLPTQYEYLKKNIYGGKP